MRTRATVRFLTSGVLAWALACGFAVEAHAQATTGTIRGFVRDTDGNPIASVGVVAVQEGTNFQRGSLTSESGFYNIAGLPPGEYTVTASTIGYGDVARTLRVLTGQTLTLDLRMGVQAVELEGIVVQAQPAVEIATSEIATNITPEQVESMPLNDRNFLALAALAPGVTFGCAGNCAPGDGGGLNVGAESANQANVFVDGVSFKNDILKGGVAGQDASKGNPFPQAAVQEFRVITQQYKAEYQKATSAIVSATTRSGSNEWDVDLFGYRQHEGLIERDFFTLQNCRNRQPGNPCPPLPVQERWQFGGSVAGPIMRDELFFFAAYEGNHQDRAFTVQVDTLSSGWLSWPDTTRAEMLQHFGTFPSEFRSDLFFGKLTWVPGERHRFELSGNVRDEFDIRNFGNRDSYQNAEDFNNDVKTFLLRHQYGLGNLLNEAQVSYQTYRWFPVQLRTDLIGLNFESGGLKLGGRCCPQDQTQRRLQFRDDVSYTVPGWMGDHVFKVGGNVDFVEYDIIKELNVNPQFTFNPSQPNIPIRVNVGFGDPNIGAENTQFGVYAQDDWSVSRRLTLSLGVRWDYESNGLNNDYVTPAAVVSELTPLLDSLIIIGNDYFTDGNDRDSFLGMIQPRLGFSYDLTGENSTVLFGGFGVYYDRNPYATLIGERERLVWTTYEIRFSDGSVPNTVAWDPSFYDREVLETLISQGTFGKPEVFLIDNNTRPPRTNQFSAGVRQAWRDYLFSVNYTGMRSDNNFTWMFANRNPDNRLFETPSYRNVIVSTDEGKAWYDAIYFKAEKPFTAEARWGGAIAYTLGWADDNFTAGRDFAGLDFRLPSDFVRRGSERDQRHIVNANWIVGLPLDIRFSGILTLASPRPYRVFYGGDPCVMGNMDCIGNEYPDGGGPGKADSTVWGGTNPFTGNPETFAFLGIGGWGFRNLDIRLEKAFGFRGNEVALIVEGFNVFDFDNFTFYEGRIGDLQADGTIVPNSAFGNRTGVITDPTLPGAPPRWQFGLRFSM